MIDPFSFSSDVGDVKVYWTLQIVFYLSMIICGRGISFSNRIVSNRYCIATVVIFSVYEGLRWLRGADYAHYYTDLTKGIVSSDPEPLYRLIVSIFSNFPFYYAFIFYGFLLICPLVLLLKRHKKEAYWILPLFIIMVSGSFESHVRQYIAIGFFLFGFYFWLYDKKIVSTLFFVLTIMTHLAVSFPIVVFFICVATYNLRFEIKPVWIILALFTYFYWFWDVSYLGDYIPYLKYIKLDENSAFIGYVENSERWFTEEGSIAYRTGTSTRAAIITVTIFYLLNAMTIYIGYFFRKHSLELNVFFWFTYWALIIKSIAGDIEMILRFNTMLMYMTPLLMGIIVYKTKSQLTQGVYKILILLYYFVYIFLLHIGTRPYAGCGYIWDR